jgi:hypothetical protein
MFRANIFCLDQMKEDETDWVCSKRGGKDTGTQDLAEKRRNKHSEDLRVDELYSTDIKKTRQDKW